MADIRERIVPIEIEKEMRESYLDYSMSVIVGRALPDVRDGLKPVHRRILYTMDEMGVSHRSPSKKSARIVGDVMGKYHPHGNEAIYETLVRMAQEFSMRYPLVDGQGNFGSVDGDPPAAMRYTEARLSEIASTMLDDLDKQTVEFVPNFDESLKEPVLLPTLLPNLLVNGSDGIAVGMATKIPPHNLREVVQAVIALIEKPDLEIKKLMRYIPAPDFPTGAYILGKKDIMEVYEKGRGRVRIRSKVNVERGRSGRESIVVTEIPFQVNKVRLIERIADLVKERRIEGIADIRDESDREGMRLVIEIRRGENTNVILNNLFAQTPLEVSYGVIMLALIDGQPKIFNLQEMLQNFIDFRVEVVTKRSKYLLEEAKKRAHILEGLKIAVDNIDEVVKIIRGSKTVDLARSALMTRFSFSEAQARAILDMRLARLTGLERQKLEEELSAIRTEIKELERILADPKVLMKLIKDELNELAEKYGDERRTEIVAEREEIDIEDLIAEEEMVVTITNSGYIKRTATSTYRRQSRGGVGVVGADAGEEDFVEHLFIASTHDYILFFTDQGHCFWQKVYDLSEGGRQSRGKKITNSIELGRNENVTALVQVRDFSEKGFLFFATQQGYIKKIELSTFANPKRKGIIATTLKKNDKVIKVVDTSGQDDIILTTQNGQALRFNEREVRPMGRNAAGVNGITLAEGDKLVGLIAVKREADLLVVTENGYGKRTPISDYRLTHRGGKGVITLNNIEKVGKIVGGLEVLPEDEAMCITSDGQLIRVNVSEIRASGRATQGVQLVRPKRGKKVVAIARIIPDK